MMRAPAFWYAADPRALGDRQDAPALRALLAPLSWIYAAAARAKQAHARPARVEAFVVCVGNLTVGGVGKTPIVRSLRERLSAKGFSVASLSRGHGGRLKGPVRVDGARHGSQDVGDEPLLHAGDGLAVICRDRLVGAEACIDFGADAIVMDDGFQNTAIFKDLSLLVFDARLGLGNGRVLPAGPLREPALDGLARADAAILMGEGPIPAALHAFPGPILRAWIEPVGRAPEGPLLAFAGIGDPAKFFETLKGLGGEIVEAMPYPDHHPYTEDEVRWLQKLARERGANLITTEKDAARLSPAWRSEIATLPVRARFEDPALIDALIDKAFRGYREAGIG